jgi:hypothetical protein
MSRPMPSATTATIAPEREPGDLPVEEHRQEQDDEPDDRCPPADGRRPEQPPQPHPQAQAQAKSRSNPRSNSRSSIAGPSA